tara:strand:+ start:750 stop:1475 length:726 start_codon:yes stop_codon:yes gene_type:complete
MAKRKGNETDYTALQAKYPNLDLDLIAGFEGTAKSGPNVGYWPGTDSSGVTIGLGIDLAWTNINRFNISDALKAKLAPYSITYGKNAKGEQIEIEGPVGRMGAGVIVNRQVKYRGEPQKYRRNLVLTDAEINELNLAKGSMIYNNISNDFNDLTGREFNSLPDEVQSTIMSVGWQIGENFISQNKAPRLINKLQNAVINTGDWSQFIGELKVGNWSDPNRRRDEGIYLEGKLKGNVNGKTR